ncbi:dnaJ homolog dnj-5 [Tenebrio molitor]|jgi:DnaJ family protein C protein 14|uniref:dnaJ homolog dnj-5 n=1 Tax=Tenebrio molitor TaxID=7067 RepID=UPI0036246AA0
MSDNERNCSNEAVEKIIGNMTAEMQTADGQYAPLGFSPPPTESLNWNQPPYVNNFNPYQPPSDIPLGYVPLQQFSTPYSYLQQPHHFDINEYNKNLDPLNLKYNVYEPMQNGSPDAGVFRSDFTMLNSNLHQPDHHILQPQHDPLPQTSNHTHLIENLVGNWVPNTTGTYSPFGNVEPFKPTVGVFEQLSEKENNEQNLILEQPLEEKQFNFNRTNRKPRMVAEVKPMRPSYSDVLTKAVPPTSSSKPTKTDTKETKQKKDNSKKNGKTEKTQKLSSSLNRSNTNADIKDIPISEKTAQFIKTSSDKEKRNRGTQLNRKWASLDNINEPINNTKVDDGKKKKSDDAINNKSLTQKANFRKTAKNNSDAVESEATNSKNETLYVSKNGLKKTNKFNGRPKNSDSFGGGERPPGKRNQRTRRRENHVFLGIAGQKLKQYLKGWWKIFTVFLFWLVNLISDVCSLSVHISRDMASSFWLWSVVHWALFLDTVVTIAKRIRILSWIWEKLKKPEKPAKDNNRSFIHSGLQNNINMPTTGEEAMKRLLACKGKDPYSILGVTPTCTDDDIKRYYKRQAFLVHPDKNQQPGAEEAFKILVHAFDMIGEPERRAAYDKGVVESVQVEQAWSELTELLAQLQQKVEAAANTIRCSACGLRHKRIKVDRPCYAARNCSSCKIHHSAREGDIWAEARCFGFLWHYYACMEGNVYDITEWAGCQKDSLKHLRPDSHQVQYRIALGKQASQPRRHSGSLRNEKPPDLENLLNTLYGQTDCTQQGAKRRNKKANK